MILENDVVIKVTNRADSYIGYGIPEAGIRRRFAPGEMKEITMGELRQLHWVPGGMSIISNYLIIDNVEAVNELIYNAQPEHFYTKADVRKLLEEGTEDQLLDCLDFAPEGVVQLVKDVAVEIKLNDVRKRDAIYKKTGFNVSKAIEINIETSETAETGTAPVRRSATVEQVEQVEQPQRRAATPSTGYQIIKK